MYRKSMLMGILLAVVAGVVPVQASLQDGLIAYFKLDEGGGTAVADASGSGNNGTLIGTNLALVPGYDGGSLGCTAPSGKDVGDRLEFPTTGMSATAGTVALWTYLSDPQPASSGRYLFGHTTQPQFSNRIQVYMQQVPSGTDPVRSLHIGLGGSHTTKQNIKELPLKEWLQVVLTWDNGKYFVYVNNAQVDTGTYSGLTGIHPIANFGNDGSNAPYEAFSGMIDEARVYSRAITAAEVKEIFQLPHVPRIKAWGPSPADGARDVTLPLLQWKSLDTFSLHNVYVGTTPDLVAADLIGPRQPLKMFFYVPGLKPGTTYYWRVDEVDPDGTTIHPGDVWSFLAQPATAYDPTPASGANTAGLAPVLTWSKGTNALEHHLYFGDSQEAVQQGAASVDKGKLTDPTFALADLKEATTYYWRVDEIGPGDVVKAGDVWSFTTVVPVDDFESYNDDIAAKTTIFDTWIDGLTNSLSGSIVGNAVAPFAEQTIIHGGKQSMPLDYNNVKAPFYSEAERTFAPLQNWTADGVNTLVLYVRSKVGSKAAPVYVQLKDSSNKTGTVTAEAALVSAAKWTEWKIPLDQFATAGVNLAKVKTIVIGVGDKANPAAGGTGVIYVDDIGLAKPLAK